MRHLVETHGGTVRAESEDRGRALAVGYQVHLAKPVEPAEFALVVANLVGRGGTSGGQ